MPCRDGCGHTSQFDEELIDAEEMGQIGAVRQVPASPASLVPAGQILAAVSGDYFGTELAEDVVVGIGAAFGSERPEAAEEVDLAEPAEPTLGEVERAVQGVVDLERGEYAVV